MPDVPVTTSEAEALRARAARCRAQAKAFQSEFGPKLIILAEELEKRAEAIEARAVPAQPPRSA